MAIQVMSEVWEFSKARGAELLVLLAIADRARSEDAVAWPGMNDIAKRARINHRQTRRLVAALIDRGELKLVSAGGHGLGDSNTYQVTVGRYQGVALTPLQGGRRGKKGGLGDRNRGVHRPPEPSVNRQEPVVVSDEKTGRLRIIAPIRTAS